MDINKLKGKMKEEQITQEKMAEKLGISTQAFNAKINGKKKFTLDEAVKITNILEIQNPIEIFFAPDVSKMQQKVG